MHPCDINDTCRDGRRISHCQDMLVHDGDGKTGFSRDRFPIQSFAVMRNCGTEIAQKQDMESFMTSDVSKNTKPDTSSLRALLPLVPFALQHKARICAGIAALAAASAATLTIPLAVRTVVDFGFTAENADLISAYFGLLLAVVGLLAVASSLRYYFVMTFGERVVADLRSAVFAHLTRLDAAFYDRSRSGELVSRLSADTTQLKSAFGASASIALRNIVLFLGATVMMVWTAPRLSALVLVAIPLIVLPLIVAGRSVRRRSRDAQDALAETSAYATEQIGASRTMQIFGAGERVRRVYDLAVEKAYATVQDSLFARALLTAVAIFFIFASVIGILWLGAQAVIGGTMSGGNLSQFILYAVFAASSLSQLSEVWTELSAAAGAAGRIAELLETRPAVDNPDKPIALPAPGKGMISLENVTFAYPSQPDHISFGPVTLRVHSGERIAIVGPSGAGKSTFVQLVARFYDPTEGRILIDGIDIRDASLDDLRFCIALVPQDPVIFSGTIAENLRYAKPDASDTELRLAARQASALTFIEAMQSGFESIVGERGVTLSGGERQRLAIARAILKDAPILLLDEATSALDAENEAVVQAALDTLMRGRTTIVIAHRLATILAADRILVMDHGQIVEEGTHRSLSRNKTGLYARLAKLQFDDAIRAASDT
jgi:ATP-binding cassette, subfamily B, bacterial